MEKPIFGNIVGAATPSAYVSYGQEMNLTEDQKKIARENIGALKENIPIVKNNLTFEYYPETDTWNDDPTLTYTGTG
jgi:hypothetical protein